MQAPIRRWVLAGSSKEKRDYFTLTYLQELSRRNGHMEDERALRMGRASRRGKRRRR